MVSQLAEDSANSGSPAPSLRSEALASTVALEAAQPAGHEEESAEVDWVHRLRHQVTGWRRRKMELLEAVSRLDEKINPAENLLEALPKME